MESTKDKLDRLWDGSIGDRLELDSFSDEILRHVNRYFQGKPHVLVLCHTPPARIRRHCVNVHCQREQFFHVYQHRDELLASEENGVFSAQYHCGNCNANKIDIVVSMAYERSTDKRVFVGRKLAEYPIRFAPIEARLRSILGTDFDLMTKGLNCEQLGLGVGAASYYRRIVENRKNVLLDEMIKVCNAIGGYEAAVIQLERAKAEVQFSKAIDMVASGLPDTLKVQGQNPLTLLHSSLSQNIHADNDAECLEGAKATRAVLVELARRIDETLKDRADVAAAVAVLNRKRSDRNGAKA